MRRIIRSAVQEANQWIDSLVSSIPGRLGIGLRTYWASAKFKSADQISIEMGCDFSGTSSITFAGNASIGKGSFFAAEGGRISIGTHVFFNRNVHINASVGGEISIGPNCLIGPNVVMRTAGHCFNRTDVPICAQGHEIGNINIGGDCWIGANAVIVGGVTLGAGVVVGAGAVVTRDVPPNTVVAGVPAKFISVRGEHNA
jgi:acetyltransferase-like isoleucine patch superfamily enzyme